MSYLKWRKDNEDRVLDIVDDCELEKLPAWQSSSGEAAEFSDAILSPVVVNMMKKEKMIPINFCFVFMEYLFEEYHVSTLDVELFTKMLINAEIDFIDSMANEEVSSAAFVLLHQIRSLLPEESKKHLDEAIDKLAELGDEANDPDTKNQESK